jgi:hypothetical protein
MAHTRRDVLYLGAAAALSLAGCTSNGPGGDDETTSEPGAGDGDGAGNGDGDEDSEPVLTGYELSDTVVTPGEEHFSDLDSWGLFLASREAAETAWEDETEAGVEEVRAFIGATAFEAGERLVYVHSYGSQTCYEMTLDGEPRIADDGLPVVEATVDRTAPADQPCGDAVVSVHLLLRLSFDPSAPSPDTLEVHVAGNREEVEELRLEAKR